jgi:chemotaxis protein CheD
MTQATPKRIHFVQGEYRVSDDPDVVLTTILGSCVGACMRDPVANVGGMNHFLLPGNLDRTRQDAERYGVHLMELLVNGLLQRGAQRQRLEAKLFGGARTIEKMINIGEKNAEFAQRFLRNENIKHIGGSLGGLAGRRIEFWPVTGRARQYLLSNTKIKIPEVTQQVPKIAAEGSIEFF